MKLFWNLMFYTFLFFFLIVTGFLVYELLISPLQNKESYDQVAEIYRETPSPELIEKLEKQDETKILTKFYGIFDRNPDLRGWLTIPGTKYIDYPIVQTDNNFDYLEIDFQKRKSKNGTLFFDKNNSISLNYSSQCLVIYGHNMKTGQMFHELVRYRDVNYYRKHPTLVMDTVYQENQYKVFACFLVGAKETNFFDYRKFDFEHPALFQSFVRDIQSKSFFSTPVDILDNDSILLLSTCSYEFDGARLVVAARMIRPGESVKVDTKAAKQLKDADSKK